jgi:hypothetical protein
MPEPPWPEPLPLHAAVALALDREP